MDAAIPADAQNAPTGIWKSRTEREIPTAPTPIIVVVNERKNNGDSNSVAKPSTESDQAHKADNETARFQATYPVRIRYVPAYSRLSRLRVWHSRPRRRAPRLTASDRLLFGFGSLFLSPGRIRKVAIGVRPSTLLAFHQALVRRTYRRLFSSSACPKQPGPKGPSEALIQAIVELKSRNPRFGCPRSARIISRTFGANIDKNIVYRVLSKHYRPTPGGTGPSWLSFIGHTTDSLWSVDLFRCESIVLRSYWVLVVLDQCTRRLVGVGVHRGPVNGADLCRMFNAAMHGRGAPRHLSTDHDPLFEAHRWTANLRILEIDAIKTVPHVPRSHPFVERLIGTTRRECLDHILFWNARDLERTLADFQASDNEVRSPASLKGHTPSTFVGGHMVASAELNNVRWVTAGTWFSSQWRPDNEFETDRRPVGYLQ